MKFLFSFSKLGKDFIC